MIIEMNENLLWTTLKKSLFWIFWHFSCHIKSHTFGTVYTVGTYYIVITLHHEC